jgi:hypothetical protein
MLLTKQQVVTQQFDTSGSALCVGRAFKLAQLAALVFLGRRKLHAGCIASQALIDTTNWAVSQLGIKKAIPGSSMIEVCADKNANRPTGQYKLKKIHALQKSKESNE